MSTLSTPAVIAGTEDLDFDGTLPGTPETKVPPLEAVPALETAELTHVDEANLRYEARIEAERVQAALAYLEELRERGREVFPVEDCFYSTRCLALTGVTRAEYHEIGGLRVGGPSTPRPTQLVDGELGYRFNTRIYDRAVYEAFREAHPEIEPVQKRSDVVFWASGKVIGTLTPLAPERQSSARMQVEFNQDAPEPWQNGQFQIMVRKQPGLLLEPAIKEAYGRMGNHLLGFLSQCHIDFKDEGY